MFQNRVLREIFRPKREEVTAEHSKVHKYGMHVLKQQIEGDCARRVAGRIRVNYNICTAVDAEHGKHILEDLGVDGMIKLKWILQE